MTCSCLRYLAIKDADEREEFVVKFFGGTVPKGGLMEWAKSKMGEYQSAAKESASKRLAEIKSKMADEARAAEVEKDSKVDEARAIAQQFRGRAEAQMAKLAGIAATATDEKVRATIEQAKQKIATNMVGDLGWTLGGPGVLGLALWPFALNSPGSLAVIALTTTQGTVYCTSNYGVVSHWMTIGCVVMCAAVMT